jgi:hypothetical protein
VTEVAVVVPTLGRPHRVERVLDTFTATAPARVLFVADHDDHETLFNLRELGAEHIVPGGNYAKKIRAGIDATDEPYIFTGGDDLEGKTGWFETALAALVDPVQVVGLNDLIPRPHRPRHATHFLMTRAYANQPTIDGRAGPFFQGYHHWFMDDEFIATAKHRGVYTYAQQAQILHLHPMAGLADDDETYVLGRQQRRQDGNKFMRRTPLWT